MKVKVVSIIAGIAAAVSMVLLSPSLALGERGRVGLVCSKAQAVLAVLDSRGLRADAFWRDLIATGGAYGKPGTKAVATVTCGDINRDGRRDMAVVMHSGGVSGASSGWAVFVQNQGRWRLVLDRSGPVDWVGKISRGTILGRIPVTGPDVAHCCPSEFQFTRWRWRNGKLVVVKRWRASATETIYEFTTPARGLFPTLSGSRAREQLPVGYVDR